MTELITITGNLAADPERRTAGGGASVTHFRVGSTHRRFDKAAERWIDVYTNWYQVSAFRALGDNAFSSLRKGDRVIVTGRLRLREWDNGTKRGVAAEIDADAVGPDLLWGRTTFHKVGDARSHDSAGAAADDGTREDAATPTAAPAPTDAAGWTIPAAPAPDADTREPLLAETPF